MQTIDIETTSAPQPPATMALERQGEMAVGRALSLDQLHERLAFIRSVMRQEMKEGQDYGKIPGAGDRPCLLQPGAQKLLMTFNLREQVKREVLREIPHPLIPGHREYEFTVTVFPSGLDQSQGWDGVGTCSTFESKYRYRKATRKCPACGKAAIIAGKEEYGGGFICWKKKDGCGQKFDASDQRIAAQSVEDVENEDPADQWNTVRKMAFKRALVAAAINATNTSELWTQDIEDMAANESSRPKPIHHVPVPVATVAASQPKAVSQNKPAVVPPKAATAATLKWYIQKLTEGGHAGLALLFYHALENPAALLPNEGLDGLPTSLVPISNEQLAQAIEAIVRFGESNIATHPFPPNPIASVDEAKAKAAAAPAAAPEAVKSQAAAATGNDKSIEARIKQLRKNPEWFWKIVVTIPRKGMKKAEYEKNADTIQSLYRAIQGGDKDAGHRLWGLANKWAPAPREWNGKVYQPTDADHILRAALDDFASWHELDEPDEREEHF